MKSFAEFYRENKPLIIIYITIALAASMFLYYTSLNMAYTGREVMMGENTVGSFGVALQISSQKLFGVSISPSYVVGMSSLMSIMKEHNIWSDSFPNMTFGMFDFWWARVLAFVWVFFTLASSIVGAKIEEINTKYVGPFMLIALEVAGVLYSGGGAMVNAAYTGMAETYVGGGLLAAIEFFKLMVMLTSYLFIRYFSYAVSLLLTLVCGMNSALSGFVKFMRGTVITMVLLLSEKHPALLVLLLIILLIISVFVFQWAYRLIRYFKTIYVTPFFRWIFARNRKIALIDRKCPKKISSSSDFSNVRLAIPTFTLMDSIGNVKVKKREKWWLVADDNCVCLYRDLFLNRQESRVILKLADNSNGQQNQIVWYIRQAGLLKRAYLEVFTLLDNSSQPTIVNKGVSMVFSREYTKVYEDILSQTGFVDYKFIIQARRDEKRRAVKDKAQEIKSMFGRKKTKL